jgi:hypothetical protein
VHSSSWRGPESNYLSVGADVAHSATATMGVTHSVDVFELFITRNRMSVRHRTYWR